MRSYAMTSLVWILAVLVLVRCGDGASLHHMAMAEDGEDIRPRFSYRDYALYHRNARADDAFDDYGHLRFGRSGD